MITLHVFGPALGLPDPSPFVTKAELLLKMAALPYRTVPSDPRKAPKGKLPYIEDGATVVADSTFIRLHLEEVHNIDFDGGLTVFERAVAWATEKMCEDHLYWTLVHARWADEANFRNGPARFFDPIPAPIRPAIRAMVRRSVVKRTQGQGMGRHTPDEIAALGIRDVAALATLLGDKPYLMGAEPCGADATVFAFVAGALCPVFETPVRDAAESHTNLVTYRDRMMGRYFPELRAAA
jgi:glutathione S-transferase